MFFQPNIVEGYIIDFQKQIGVGSYGKVFDCRSVDLSRQQFPLCAKVIEVIDPKSAQTEEKILNTLKEKAKFNPNIVNVEKVVNFEQERLMVVIMEKCQCNLQQELEQKKSYKSEEVKEILKQILNGYLPLFKEQILHRDMKPENILIGECGGMKVYKLSDFGVGKIYKKNDYYFTQKGTIAYAAPEINQLIQDSELLEEMRKQKKQKSFIDIYSDQYSFNYYSVYFLFKLMQKESMILQQN